MSLPCSEDNAQAFAVERAELDLEVAETALSVLEEFTKEKILVGLKATAESAKARNNADNAALELEQSRKERLETQYEKCTILAPDNGMVIYANEMGNRRPGGGGGGAVSLIEEGASVKERQTLIKLPDLARMQVKTTVHESKVDQIRRGMRARIQVQDREFQGTVTMISSQPEPTDFFRWQCEGIRRVRLHRQRSQGIAAGYDVGRGNPHR